MIDLKLGIWHLAGVNIVDVVVHKDASIEVAVQDETRNTGNKNFEKEKEEYLEKTSPITHPTTYSSLRLQKGCQYTEGDPSVRGLLPLPFEFDPCPSGVGTIHSHCQVVVISAGGW